MKLVILISSYREGPLIRGAIQTAMEAAPDAVVVWEGPAGTDRLPDAPASDLGFTELKLLHWHSGEWSTDADKRTMMLTWAKQQWQGPLWALWLDGDELLMNGRYLRDQIQSLQWADEQRGASIATPDNPPVGGLPIRLVEPDGSVALCKGKLVRVDLIRSYLVSNLTAEMVNGAVIRLGNVPQSASEWIEPRVEAHGARDKLFLLPPLPGEPYLVHRSHLRHPARVSNRMHEQEASELERLGMPTGELRIVMRD